MTGIQKYLITVILAVIASGLAAQLTRNTATGKLIKWLCGVIVTITLLTPASGIPDVSFLSTVSRFVEEGRAEAQEGQNQFQEQFTRRIKEEAEAYIQEKAFDLGADIRASITLSQGELPLPEAIEIWGEISETARSQLEKILTADLGIPKENQAWNGLSK